MLKHVAVLAIAVLFALGLAQEVVKLSAAGTSPPPGSALVAAAPADPTPVSQPVGAAQVVKAADGHYWAEALVDGRWIHCLIDTGATSVALTSTDAQRLGLDPSALDYNVSVTTANGQGRGAQVELASVSVAGAEVQRVPAIVVKDGLSTSLLGMSYLGRLSRLEATPTSLILRP